MQFSTKKLVIIKKKISVFHVQNKMLLEIYYMIFTASPIPFCLFLNVTIMIACFRNETVLYEHIP